MNTNMYVKVKVPKNTEYYVNGNDYPYQTENDYYTTIDIKSEDLDNDRFIKYLAKENLVKQIAKKELFSIKRWKYISINPVDFEIIR